MGYETAHKDNYAFLFRASSARRCRHVLRLLVQDFTLAFCNSIFPNAPLEVSALFSQIDARNPTHVVIRCYVNQSIDHVIPIRELFCAYAIGLMSG